MLSGAVVFDFVGAEVDFSRRVSEAEKKYFIHYPSG
jgi:hypothetical protein